MTVIATGTVVGSESRVLDDAAGVVMTGIVVPILLGLFAADVNGRYLVVLLALVILAHLWFEWRYAPDQDHA